MKLREGSYDYYDCFGHTLAKIQIGFRNSVRSSLYHGKPWCRQGCLYWVKWVDISRRQLFIVPCVSRAIGCIITFDEYYDIFCRGV